MSQRREFLALRFEMVGYVGNYGITAAVALAAILAALIAPPALAQERAAPAAVLDGTIPAKYHDVWCYRRTQSSGSYRKHAVEAAGESCDKDTEFTITADRIIDHEQTCKVVASLPERRYVLVTLDCSKTGLEREIMYDTDELGRFYRYKTQRYLCRGKLTHGHELHFSVGKCSFVVDSTPGAGSVLEACGEQRDKRGRLPRISKRYCEVSVEADAYYNVKHIYSARAK
jgi:hypothetical protein